MRGWRIGACINLIGSVVINLGTNLMKLGHNKRAVQEEGRLGKKIGVWTFKEWQAGIFFFLSGNILNFISFGYAAQSLLAAMGSFQFISNVAFASIVLGEKVTRLILCATGCIVAGCVTLVLFGSHASKRYTVDELMELYTAPGYVAYLIALVSIVTIMYSVYKCGKPKMMSILDCRRDYEARGVRRKVGMTGLDHYWYRALPLSYATFSGLIGTQSVLFSKTLSTLLRVTIGGNSQLTSWFTWAVVVFFLMTSTFWMSRLNKALKFFPAMIIVPTMQISWTFFSIVSGMLYFQEYRDLELMNAVIFAAAVVVVFFGVFLLTTTRAIEQRLPERLDGDIVGAKCREHSETDEMRQWTAASRDMTPGWTEPNDSLLDDMT